MGERLSIVSKNNHKFFDHPLNEKKDSIATLSDFHKAAVIKGQLSCQ